MTASRLSRRSFLAAGGLAAGALLAPGEHARSLAAAAFRGRSLRPVRMGSLHVHASFSEGQGSMAAALSEARRYGSDVVWWTEHDFRMAAQGYRTAVGFDGPFEGTGTTRWDWVPETVGTPASTQATYAEEPHSPDEAGRALRLEARGEGERFSGLRLVGMAWNSTYTTNLADTTVELDVLAQALGEDAILAIEMRLSYHPATGGRPAGQYRLRYELGPEGEPPPPHPDPADPLLGIVPLRSTGDEIGEGWRRLALRPVQDIAACWPDLYAADNGLFRIHVNAWARRGATVRVALDRLRFHRSRRAGDESLAMQAEFIRHYAEAYPELRQYQSSEISLVRHLNWFGGDFHLPRYPGYYPDGPPVRNGGEEPTRRMIDYIHSAGGLAQLNHPTDDNDDLAAYLVRTRALGADLVEIGRNPLEEYLGALDVAARNAVFFTATGINDDHGGLWARNFPWATSVWSRSAERDHLVAALRAGRAWMTDPARYRGELDFEVRGRPAMGAVVSGAPASVNLRISATDLPAGGALEIVEGPIDLPGGTPDEDATRTETIAGAALRRRGTVRYRVPRGHFVRTAVRDGAGAIVGLSNPVWLLDRGADVEVPPARRLRL